VRRDLVAPADTVEHGGDERRSYYAITEDGETAVRLEARLLASLARDVLATGEGPA
jgi:DNA-binding PadR family transcriptional regulator